METTLQIKDGLLAKVGVETVAEYDFRDRKTDQRHSYDRGDPDQPLLLSCHLPYRQARVLPWCAGLQGDQIDLENMRAGVADFQQRVRMRRALQVDAGHGSLGAFEDGVL